MQQKIIDQLTLIVNGLLEGSSFSASNYKIRLQENKDKEHGDYSSNIAMILARDLSESPKILADKISKDFPLDDQILKVKIAGPGFINFFISEATHAEVLKNIDSEKEKYGHNRNQLGKVLIEYVSSNPTGPLHVGHGRGAVFGSVLAKLLTAAGYKVDEEYYVNDFGRQMNILTVSIWLRYLQNFNKDIIMSGLGYQGDYIKLIADELVTENKEIYLLSDKNYEEMLTLLKDQKEEKDIDALILFMQKTLGEGFSKIRSYALDSILNIIKSDLINFGVKHNSWFFESSLYKEEKGNESKADTAISKLNTENYIYKQDGAVWFKSSKLNDDKDRVLKRGNGEYTYFSSDIAYHLEKYNRSYDRIINIWGSDHHGYLPRVKAAMEALGKDTNKLEVVFIQFANLVRNGEKISMSTRSGEFISLSELIEEVTAEAARFFYINRKADQHLEFDLELAKEQSKDNPLYYIQYAHARICSVFNKVDYDFNKQDREIDLALLNSEKEINIQKHLATFPALIEKAAKSNDPHLICYYLKDLASLFHSYYNSEKFIVKDSSLMISRMFLLKGVKQVIFNGLEILGVSSPEKM
tara:strand:- start:23899 stop:25650 length:1752 start_codon:yes stop_codon:yes gene_type:complete